MNNCNAIRPEGKLKERRKQGEREEQSSVTELTARNQTTKYIFVLGHQGYS